MNRKEKEQNQPLKECVLGWIEKLSAHFNSPQDEEQIKIFIHALKNNSKWQVNQAFERCLNECEFMPKLADVHRRMPEERYPPRNPEAFVQRKPTLDLTRSIAEEICVELTGREYDTLDATNHEDNLLIRRVFGMATHIRFIRMGRAGKWPKTTKQELEMAGRKAFEDWANV